MGVIDILIAEKIDIKQKVVRGIEKDSSYSLKEKYIKNMLQSKTYMHQTQGHPIY